MWVINRAEMLELLKHKNISIGTRLEVKKKFEFDHSMEIKIRSASGKSQPFTISEQLAKNIFVTNDATISEKWQNKHSCKYE